jgi:general stress protein YciG
MSNQHGGHKDKYGEHNREEGKKEHKSPGQNFKNNEEDAREAGRKGGEHSHGGTRSERE